MKLTTDEKNQLLEIARYTISFGLKSGKPPDVHLSHFKGELQKKRASFITLKIETQLRGCMGSLKAVRPLLLDVVENAYNAAFRDPRFPPLKEDEFDRINLHISVLNEPLPLKVRDEKSLLSELKIGEDGLILRDGTHHATFLPAVWESLPDPEQFLKQLKLKAGLKSDHWSDSIRFMRYSVEEFP